MVVAHPPQGPMSCASWVAFLLTVDVKDGNTSYCSFL